MWQAQLDNILSLIPVMNSSAIPRWSPNPISTSFASISLTPLLLPAASATTSSLTSYSSRTPWTTHSLPSVVLTSPLQRRTLTRCPPPPWVLSRRGRRGSRRGVCVVVVPSPPSPSSSSSSSGQSNHLSCSSNGPLVADGRTGSGMTRVDIDCECECECVSATVEVDEAGADKEETRASSDEALLKGSLPAE
jgi:hypothetical protein